MENNENKKQDNIKKLLQNVENEAKMDSATIEFVNALPHLGTCCKAMYDELINQGFNQNQAYDFMKDYMIKLFLK